jgi:hypothetical protein
MYLTMALILPPAPLPLDAPATEFSAGRAMQDLEVIARQPHPMGANPAHAAVRDTLAGEIRKLDLEPQVQDTFGAQIFASGYIIGGAVENILVRLPGSDPEGAILLLAHYDSTPGGPGAADNGSGVVTILELLRALQAGPQLRQDVIFLFADGEEPGTIGARAFIEQHPWVEDVICVINLDTITHAPPTLLRTSGGDGAWIQAWSRSGATRSAFLSLPYHLFGRSLTDLSPFENAGVPGADFAATGAFTELHTSEDRIEVVSPASLQQTGEQLLALVRYLGDQDRLEFNAPDQTFFPALGQLIHYPAGWALPLAVVAGLCFLGTLIYGFRKRNLTWLGLGLSLVAFLIYVAASLGITFLIWQGIQALHPDYQYSTVRPHLSGDALYLVGFGFLALAVATGMIVVARKKVSSFDLAAGALVIWLPGAIAAAVYVPATSYLGSWVLLFNSLALLLALVVQTKKSAWLWAGLGFMASAILVTFLWLPLVYLSFLGSGFPMWWIMIAEATLWLGALLPAWDWITSPLRWPLPTAALLVALGFLLAGHFLVGKDSPPPMVNSLGYWLDADAQEARWVAFIGGTRTDARTTARYEVAFPEQMDQRQSGLLVNPIRQPYTDLFPSAPPFSVLTSVAPGLALDGPRLEVLSDEWVDYRRLVNIRFTTSLHDRLYIVLPTSSLVAITLPRMDRTGLAENSEWWLRFDGMPPEGLEIKFEFSVSGTLQFLLVEEKTGVPSFPGLDTQPLPGTMSSPGEFLQGVPTDFTAIYRRVEILEFGAE